MADEGSARTLLRAAADELGVVAPPSVETLTRRRTQRRRRVAAIGCAVLLVAGLGIGLRFGVGTSRPARPAATHTVPPPGPVDLTGYTWQALPPAPIRSRSYPVAVWTGHVLIVWGGSSANAQYDDGAIYDPATRRWTTMPKAPIAGLPNAMGTWVDGSLVIWGDGIGARFDLAKRHWTRLPPVGGPTSEPDGSTAQLVTVGDRALLVRAAGQLAVRADLYDPATDRWQRLPDRALEAGHELGVLVAVSAGTTAFVWSEWSHTTQLGAGTFGIKSGIDGYRLDPVRGTWTPFTMGPTLDPDGVQWTGRQLFLPGTTYWCGTLCRGPLITVARPTLVDARTGQASPLPKVTLELASYFWTGNAVLAVDLNGSASNQHPGAAAVWSPGDNRWTSLSSGTPDAADDAAAVWAGDRLLVWGGHASVAAEFARR